MQCPKPAKRKGKNKQQNVFKRYRLVDPGAIEAARKPHSELSGLPAYGAAPHHWYITVGAGGPDHKYNLIQLTATEHIKAHAGEITKDELAKIVAEREGLPVEVLLAEIQNMRG